MPLCKCGCNQEADYGNWLIGHWNRGRPAWNKGLTESSDNRVKKYARKGVKHHFYGKHLPLEMRKKISESNKGKTAGSKHYMWGKSQTAHQKLVASITHKGRIVTEETRLKLSEASRGKPSWCKGLTKETDSRVKKQSILMKGKKHSETTKLKMANAQKGELHWNWQNGISFIPYCPKFNKQLKEAIRNRDNRICQFCGSLEDGTKLAIHHIHYDKENCHPDLIALCKSCNSKVNKKEQRRCFENLFMNNLNNRQLLFWRYYATS